MDHRSDRLLLVTQASVGVIALAIMSLYPPTEGRILLIPIVDRDVNATARLALSSGAALLGAGPLRGSLVVVGNRARLAAQLRPWRILMLAAPPAGCGTPSRQAAAA
ncbi:hypothetical protein [Sphingomonas sp. 8AM]|uniref:hypothetical protein n=1 Tax=Sphingomonas sp. 8AM TaxID=2653170 RepID=UPI0012F35440|nr:hypothetical protein [Sphingomonas sp. 8AM]VXC66780.1 conserved hypothetical protein [Sphingomonas sp. 8AM]